MNKRQVTTRNCWVWYCV